MTRNASAGSGRREAMLAHYARCREQLGAVAANPKASPGVRQAAKTALAAWPQDPDPTRPTRPRS